MSIDQTTFYIISGIIVAIFLILSYIIRNLLIKVEKYEDVTIDQTQYLQNISNLIGDSKKHLSKLDERGVFQSDDEVGTFSNNLKAVQDELNKFKLPSTYGKEEIQS